MKRLFVLALIASLCYAPSAFAAESLLQSAARVAKEMSQNGEAVLSVAPSTAVPGATVAGTPLASAATATQPGPGLSESGLSRGKKLLIGLAIAAAFVGIVYTIDHSVEDNTPSSRGERLD